MTVINLDESNSDLYQPRATKQKNAVLIWEPANYTLEWGAQAFDGPHMLIDGQYGCALKEFFDTHKPSTEPNTWTKTASIRAYKATEDTEIVTMIDGNVEATSTVPAGGWIVQNQGGEVYCITPAEFEERYQLVAA